MGNLIESLVRYKFAWFLCLICCFAYVFFFVNRAHVSLTIEVEKKTAFKIYWAEEGQLFSEGNMALVIVKPEKKEYSFFLKDIRKIKQLRIDPQEYIGTSTIEKLSIKQSGRKEIVFDTPEAFSRLKPLAQIEKSVVEKKGITTVAKGKDANYSFDINLEKEDYDWQHIIRAIVVICVAVLLVYFSIAHLNFAYRYIPAMLTVVLTLALTMALISERNAHPDEYVHIAASKYYTEHWLPPVIGDKAAEDTYSVYGISRLNTDEIYYLFSGKFVKIIEGLQIPEHTAFRMFNVFLLVLIVLYTLRVPDARLVAVPLLLSPQIWYLFSYCNSDAFAITAAFFTGCQIVVPESSFNRVLKGEGGIKKIGLILVAAFFFGVLFLVKKNFLSYVAFVIWLVLLRIWQVKDSIERKAVFQRFVVICLIALSLFAIKKTADLQINGFDRQQKITAQKEKKALPLYNPHTPLEEQHTQLYIQKRGVPINDIISKYRWFEKTFRSSFGVYGYSTISGGLVYYDLVRWTGLAFFIFFFTSILCKLDLVNWLRISAVLFLSAALIGISLYHSWTQDFQAQGRYLIPILPMLGILCAESKDYVNSRIFTLLTSCMFALAVYSFIYIALHNIPRMLNI